MVEARDRVRAARAMEEEDRAGLPPLEVRDTVVGQHPQTMEWSLDGEVSAVTHGNRAYSVRYPRGCSPGVNSSLTSPGGTVTLRVK